MTRRLPVTPGQLRGFLEVLTPYGFTAAKVELTPAGGLILHGDVTWAEEEADPLAAWEAARDRPSN